MCRNCLAGSCDKEDSCYYSHDETKSGKGGKKGKKGDYKGGKGGKKGVHKGGGKPDGGKSPYNGGDARQRASSAKTAAEMRQEICKKSNIGECHLTEAEYTRSHKTNLSAQQTKEVEEFRTTWNARKAKGAGGVIGAKGKGKGDKGKGTGKKSRPCNNYHITGVCSYGNKCFYSHGGAKPTIATASPKAKAEPSAKAKTKAKAKVAKERAEKDKARSTSVASAARLLDIPWECEDYGEIDGDWEEYVDE